MRPFKLIKFISIAPALAACGIIQPGDSLNEGVPAGYSEVARAAITPLAGTVSGSVAVYFKEAGPTDQYVVRLESFELEGVSFGRVRLKVNAGGAESTHSFKAASGNQNYFVNVPQNRPAWTSAVIVDPTVSPPTGKIYGTASFAATNYPP